MADKVEAKVPQTRQQRGCPRTFIAMADKVEAKVPQTRQQRGCPRTFGAMAGKVAEFALLRSREAQC